MKHAYLACSLAWLSVFAIATSTAHAAPEGPEQIDQTGETGDEEPEEGLGEEEEYKNGLIFGFSHQFHLLRDRGDPIGAALGHKENLLGFMLAFERIFHPHVSVPGSDIVEHEISDSYLGAYFF